MNYLIVGDAHLTDKSGIRKDNILETHLQKWKQIFQMASDCDATIVVLSDLLDSCDTNYKVINAFIKLRKQYPEVILTTAWGNHDEKNGNVMLREETALGNLFETETVVHTNNLSVGYNNIQNLDYSEDILAYVENKEIKKPRILCAHLFYDNAFYGGVQHNITPEMAYSLMEQGVEYIFLGHDHKNYQPVTLERNGKTLTIHRPGAIFRKKRAGYEFNRPINVVLVKEIEKKFEINYYPLEVEPFINVISNEKIFEIIKESKEEVDNFDDAGEGLLDLFKNIAAQTEEEEKDILSLINEIQNDKVKSVIMKYIS